MNDREKLNDGNLVPAGRRDLMPAAGVNRLISRGMAELAGIDIVERPDHNAETEIELTEAMARLRGVSKKLLQEMGREPTIEEIARAAGLTVIEVGWVIKKHFGISSQRLCKDKIDPVLQTLTHRERLIIELRCGLGDGFEYTHEEIGQIIKETPESVRILEEKAVRKLQHPIRSRQLEGLFDVFATKGLTKQEWRTLPEGRLICKINPNWRGDREKAAKRPRPFPELNLSGRASECMIELGIKSLSDLVSFTADELLESKNFGETVLNEVREKLGELGLALRGD